MNLGNRRLNPNACTEAEQRQNWELVEDRVADIEAGGAGDTFKVMVNSGDVTPTYAGADYLYNKIYDTGAYNAATDQVVKVEVKDTAGAPGTRQVRLFTAQSGGGTTYQVKSTLTDTTGEYLHDACQDPVAGGTYVSSSDLLVKNETWPNAGNEKERFFVDVSAINSYSGTGLRLLGMVNGTSQYMTVAYFYGEIFNDLTLVGLTYGGGELSVDEQNRLIRGLATATVATTDATFTIDGVEPLANGLDPTNGNPVTTVTIYNVHTQSYTNNEAVEAAWNPDTLHWEGMLKAEDGADGAGGTYICTIGANIAAATPGSMTSGTGTVYSVGSGGALSSVGSRSIYNPFTVAAAASNAQYSCAKTYDHPSDETLDEYTIIGLDIMAVLYNLTGAGAAKSLAIPESGSGASDIQWMGGSC